jgi:hypothetical protein
VLNEREREIKRVTFSLLGGNRWRRHGGDGGGVGEAMAAVAELPVGTR